MLVCLSPAKKLDWTARPVEGLTHPEFGGAAAALVDAARGLSTGDLRKLMHISEDLAQLTQQRFADWSPAPHTDALRPAAFAFAGDTYQGLEAVTLSADDIRWAQDHVRILSGLYGLLRPLDQIQPYRLEMGSRLATARGGTLYEYWGDTLAQALNAQAAAQGTSVLVNCASQEYFGAVDPKALSLQVITPQFLDMKNGKAKVISFNAKRARGAMARYIIQNRITTRDGLQGFDGGGYIYQPDRSCEHTPVFLRDTG